MLISVMEFVQRIDPERFADNNVQYFEAHINQPEKAPEDLIDKIKRSVIADIVKNIQEDSKTMQHELTDNVLFMSELSGDICNNGSVTHDLVCIPAKSIKNIDAYLANTSIATCYDDILAAENHTYGFDVMIPSVLPSGILSSSIMIPDDASDDYYSKVEMLIIKALTLSDISIKKGEESVNELIKKVLEPFVSYMKSATIGEALKKRFNKINDDFAVSIEWSYLLKGTNAHAISDNMQILEYECSGDYAHIPSDRYDADGIALYLITEPRKFIINTRRPAMNLLTFKQHCDKTLMVKRYNESIYEYKKLRDCFMDIVTLLKL